MKVLLGILGSIGLTTGGVAAAVLPTTISTTINTNDEYSSILVEVFQEKTVKSKNSAGEKDASTENVRFSDLQIEFHMDYDAFLKADFDIKAIGEFSIHTHLNPNVISEINFEKQESNSNQTTYVAKHHHEAQNGWGKQKGDIAIYLTIKNDNSMWIKTYVSAESYGSVSSCTTTSNLKGISFK